MIFIIEKFQQSLRERRTLANTNQRRERIMNELKVEYSDHGKFQITRANQRNILLIGCSRTGKSTIKSLFVDPSVIPDDLSLREETKREPVVESFHVSEKHIILNIIDAPSLFELDTKKSIFVTIKRFYIYIC